jgi:predicted nucleotidyltransferase
VGRAVRGLNKLLPKRQFILMGPGRWGSRGDVKLGVKVTYSDISNTAMLIEIARRRGNYVPDLSFGTHFFQDLVESAIRYLPLYPDDDGVVFNHRLLLNAENLLEKLAPSYAHLREVIRVVDVPAETRGRVLKVMMNADLDEAVALLAPPGDYDVAQDVRRRPVQRVEQSDRYWRWRFQMAERIARDLDPERFGVNAIYVFGSTKNATAGPASDIDLLVHFTGTTDQRRSLFTWLDGWSSCLEEINYLRTGYRVGKMVDVHIVTDEDIANKTSYAVKIGAVTDAARELPLGTGPKNGL